MKKFIVVKCSKYNSYFEVTFEKKGKDTWEGRETRQVYFNELQGKGKKKSNDVIQGITLSEDYKCPICKNNSIFLCPCGAFSCYSNVNQATIKCPECGQVYSELANVNELEANSSNTAKKSSGN